MSLLNLSYVDANEKYEVLRKISEIPGNSFLFLKKMLSLPIHQRLITDSSSHEWLDAWMMGPFSNRPRKRISNCCVSLFVSCICDLKSGI